jgi:hypothetical protein
MYKVVYYLGSSNYVGFKWFKTFAEAIDFSNKQSKESILEIKQYPTDEIEETVNK